MNLIEQLKLFSQWKVEKAEYAEFNVPPRGKIVVSQLCRERQNLFRTDPDSILVFGRRWFWQVCLGRPSRQNSSMASPGAIFKLKILIEQLKLLPKWMLIRRWRRLKSMCQNVPVCSPQTSVCSCSIVWLEGRDACWQPAQKKFVQSSSSDV